MPKPRTSRAQRKVVSRRRPSKALKRPAATPRELGNELANGPDPALALLQRFESQNITFIAPDGSWPIIWERARGVHVWDSRGKRYLDLTSAFGVASSGHANPNIIRAAHVQMDRLLHAMGDVHPHRLKGELASKLSSLTFERWQPGISGKTIFCNSGFEAVETALKTAALATGKAGVIAFTGAYHGLGYGALNVTHRDYFRAPFESQLRHFGSFVPFPRGEPYSAPDELCDLEQSIRTLLREGNIGAILVEPVQGRGGICVPPWEFLPMLRRIADDSDLVLIFDEIFTGFGRTGRWFACEHSRTVPDLICLGKALTGGFPLSACVGRADLMDRAWPRATGEAIHTSTFLGHPVGCAMALAQIAEIGRKKLVERSALLGAELLKMLQLLPLPNDLRGTVRGLGLMAGLELRLLDGSPATDRTLQVIKEMLHRGFILLPEGEHSNVISFTPPLTISKPQLQATLTALKSILNSKRPQ